MNKIPLVSFITVNYNGQSDTIDLIESLQKYISIPYELIVVDNASVQDETIRIKAQFPDVICIRSEVNLGFSGGNNLGIRESKGEYLFFINNDTFIEDNSIEKLIPFFESNPQIGGVSPKIKYADNSGIIQYAGSTPLSSISLRNQTIGFGEKDLGQYDTPYPTSFLHGAAMMIRRSVIKKVGEMPEIFFLYYEEIDWSTQILNAGYQLWYAPFCTVFHKESRSVGVESPLKAFYMTRNRLLYAWRNRTGVKRLLAIAYLLMIVSSKNGIQALLKQRFDIVKAIHKGNFTFIKLKSKLQ